MPLGLALFTVSPSSSCHPSFIFVSLPSAGLIGSTTSRTPGEHQHQLATHRHRLLRCLRGRASLDCNSSRRRRAEGPLTREEHLLRRNRNRAPRGFDCGCDGCWGDGGGGGVSGSSSGEGSVGYRSCANEAEQLGTGDGCWPHGQGRAGGAGV